MGRSFVMEKIDARGLDCPRPVILTKEAVDKGVSQIQVFVDNSVALSNVQRFLQKNGFSTSFTEKAGVFSIRGLKGRSDNPKASDQGNVRPDFEDVAVLVCQEIMGGRDTDLGEVLMKGFLSTLADRDTPPRVVALMNEGVKLTLADHSASDSLKKLEQRGVVVLVCGTCTNHFGITEQVQAGTVSNMFEITEALIEVQRTITLG